MSTCFVIQPFDNGGPFDKRFDDAIKPAIEKAGLTPYRVDRDPSVEIPIEDIENGIKDAKICLAEISEDNPNVWFELGYAISSMKQVVLICSNERKKFPFDVQHRGIIPYKTESSSDFEQLKENITNKINALQKKEAKLKVVSKLSPSTSTHGLSPHEMVCLVSIMQNCTHPRDFIFHQTVINDMLRFGFTKLAASIALGKLEENEYIEHHLCRGDYDEDDPIPASKITQKGKNWLYANEDELILRSSSDTFDDDSGEDFADQLIHD